MGEQLRIRSPLTSIHDKCKYGDIQPEEILQTLKGQLSKWVLGNIHFIGT